MSKWPRLYILLGRTPIATDLMTWAKANDGRRFAKEDPWSIGRDTIDNCLISTVFLGLDHSFGQGDHPVLFETMLFGGPLDGDDERYETYADAERGHADWVAKVRAARAKVDAIAEAAGATTGKSK